MGLGHVYQPLEKTALVTYNLIKAKAEPKPPSCSLKTE